MVFGAGVPDRAALRYAGRRRKARRAGHRQLQLSKRAPARQSPQRCGADGRDALRSRLHADRQPRPARSRQAGDGSGGANVRPAGSGRRRRAVLLRRPRRPGLRLELPGAGHRQSHARGRCRFPDGGRQPRAAPDAGFGHPAQHGDPRCLPEQSVWRAGLAGLRRRPRPDARAGGHADLLCDAARQCRARRRRRPQPLHPGAGIHHQAGRCSTSSRPSTRSASP